MRTPLQIKTILLTAIDEEYNVCNKALLLQVFNDLENTPISRDALETTRLGKYINQLRRKSTDKAVSLRAKQLVKKWRELIFTPDTTPHNGTFQNGNVHSSSSHRSNVHPETSVVNNRPSRPSTPCNHVPSLPSSTSTSPCQSRPNTPGIPMSSKKRKVEDDGNCSGSKRHHSHGKPALTLRVKVPAKPQLNKVKKEEIVVRSSKVRTTQEIVEKLSKRTAAAAASRTQSMPVAVESTAKDTTSSDTFTKTEIITRFFDSQTGLHPNHSDEFSPPSVSSSTSGITTACSSEKAPSRSITPMQSNSVDQILSLLPPIDYSVLLQEMEQKSCKRQSSRANYLEQTAVSDLTPALVEMELHGRQDECVNGNFDHNGHFCSWSHSVTKATSGGEILNILPYCSLDY